MGIYINPKIIIDKESKQQTAKAIAELAIKNAQKDIAIGQMAQTISQLNIELQKLKGDIQNV
jgi:hypothetical protein